jgi:hypothetical protein
VAPKKTSGISVKKGGTKMLSWSKVRRALETLGWDAEQFITRYESSGRRARKPDASLLAAGEAFDKTGDLEAFRTAVVARTTQELYAKLGRYQVWKAANAARAPSLHSGA